MNRPILLVLLGSLTLLASCASYENLIKHDPAVDEQEVYAGGVDGDADEIVPHLIYVLEHRHDFTKEAVVAALASLSERPDSRTVEAVAGLAHDPDEEVRWHVALALKAIGGELAMATLSKMATSDESELVRQEAMT